MDEHVERRDVTKLEELETKVDHMTSEINDLKKQLQPVITVWSSLEGFVTVLKWVGIIAKWVGIILGVTAAIITFGTYKKTGG